MAVDTLISNMLVLVELSKTDGENLLLSVSQSRTEGDMAGTSIRYPACPRQVRI